MSRVKLQVLEKSSTCQMTECSSMAIFNSDSLIFTYYEPNGSHGLETPLASDLMVSISKATRNWHLQHRYIFKIDFLIENVM